ncbi:energy-coupling factor transport system ATP-binding protein [Haloactinospora alba]|uniref:Energy-coupling factor transport system ATP-binding protein n=1 Tax=Haloactinospora alba TaxID=405555 RepID=A0A543NIS8_9ACTN|nr:ABC transporter ATP-binding protein [Haloactinospora alba]TQN31742.1 energy-coupling factor transport system ATP-binding protein [Haloactinospora alba]
MSLISISNLSYTYPSGVTALTGVSMDVAAGERVAIIGQNGAGKTTLARHLNGIYKPSDGTVRIAGQDTTDQSIAQLSASVGYVFQNPADQLFAKTVRRDVEFGPRNLAKTETERHRLTQWALEATGLTDQADHHPYHLSPAERKRVALASVLAMGTPAVVLDEPTTGQDHREVTRIQHVLGELHEQGTTVVAITHDMDFCAENFDRVIVMAHGSIIADGTPAEVFAQQDKLHEARVEQPQLLRLARELGWSATVITVGGFLEQLRAAPSAVGEETSATGE